MSAIYGFFYLKAFPGFAFIGITTILPKLWKLNTNFNSCFFETKKSLIALVSGSEKAALPGYASNSF